MRINQLYFLIWIACIFIISCESKKSGTSYSQIDLLVQSKLEQANSEAKENSNHGRAKNILLATVEEEYFHEASDSLKGLIYHKLGLHSYRLVQLDQAIQFVDTAIIIRKSNPVISPVDAANSHFLKSLIQERKLDYSKAIEDVNESIKIIKEHNNDEKTLAKYYKVAARNYAYLNDLARAELYYDYISKNYPKDSEQYGEHLINKALFYDKLGLEDKAKKCYNEAIELISDMPDKANNLLTAQHNLLELNTRKMKFEDAQKAYEDFGNSFTAENNHQKIAKLYIYNNLAYNYVAHNKPLKARKNYLAALNIAQQLFDSEQSVYIAEAYEGLGDVDALEGNYDASISNYHEAIKALCFGFDSDDPNALPNINEHVILNLESLTRIMGLKGDALYAKYKSSGNINDLKSTSDLYLKLDDLMVKIRQGFEASPSTYNYLEHVLPYYEKATRISIELYHQTKDKSYLKQAYSLATKNKAVVLLDGIQDGKAMVAGVPFTMLQKEKSLQEEIYALDAEIKGLTGNLDKDSLEVNQHMDLRFNKIQEYEALIQQMETEYPNYYKLKYADSEAIQIATIKSQLSDSTAVIEFFVGMDSMYTFIYSKDKDLNVFVKKKPKNFASQCSKFRELISQDSIFNIHSFSNISNSLYTLLLSEALEYINVDQRINHLTIIPDDHLFRISFEPMMTTQIPEQEELELTNELPFLLREYSISYSYSNKLLFNDKMKNSSTKKYIGFGLEYDDHTLEEFDKLYNYSDQHRLTRRIGKLTYSDDEVKECSNIFNGKHFLNLKATKSKFLKEAPKADILHLVTHGFVHGKDPMNSGLVFTKERDNYDFILRAGQLYTIDLNAEMTILSACHSGFGNLQKGEGIRSLARAINYAGCPSITASLWAAPDLSTMKIVVPYLKYIKEGKSKNEALRLSKLEYLDNCMFNKEALPCNWAHLICIGDSAPLMK